MARTVSALIAAVLIVPASVSCSLFRPVVPGPKEYTSAPTEMPRIPEPNPAALELPDGYVADIVARNLVYPTSVEFDGEGGLYVAEAGYVYGDSSAPARILHFRGGESPRVVADQLQGPVTDLLRHDGRLYVSHRGRISVVENGSVRDLVADLPSLGDHHNNQLAFGQDGFLYVGIGAATNSGVVGIDNFLFQWLPMHPAFCDTPAHDVELVDQTFTTMNPLTLAQQDEPKIVQTAAFGAFGRGMPEGGVVRGAAKPNSAVLRMRPDGSGLEVYAWGLRNPFGLAFGPDGRLYAADNGYDDRGTRPVANAPDVIYAIRQGGWYGFPDYVAGKPITDPAFRAKNAPKLTFLMKKHPPVEQPIATLPVHAGVTKIDFSTSPEFGFEGQMFVCEFGDATPITGRSQAPVGRRVARMDPRTGEVRTFLATKEGARDERDATAGLKHPMDVRFSPDGTEMYVVDLGVHTVLKTAVPLPQSMEGTGVIWRVRRLSAK